MAAFLFRLHIISFQEVIEPDGIWYVILGQNLISGAGYVNQMGEVELAYPPLYPLFIGLTSRLVHDGELAGRLVSSTAGALLILPVFYIVKGMYGRRAAHLAALVAVVYPILTHFSSMVMSEATYTLFFFSGICAGWLAISEGRLRNYILTGLLFGAAALTRPEGSLYFIIFLASMALHKRLTLLSRGGLIRAAAAIISFLVAIFPFVHFVHSQTGHWSLGNKGEEVAFISKSIVNEPYGYEKAHFAPSRDGSTMKLYTDEGQISFLDYITSNPAGVFNYYKSNLYELYKNDSIKVVPLILIPFLGIGLLFPMWNRDGLSREIYLILFLIPPLFIYPLFLTHYRRYVPFAPLGIIWIGNGMKLAWEELAGRASEDLPHLKGRSLKRVSLLLLVITFLLITWETVREKPFIDPDFRRMGLWMKENLTEGGTLMGRQPWVAYYARMKFIPFPYAEDPHEVFRYARKHNVDYVLVDYNLLSARSNLGYIMDWYRITGYPEEMKPIANAGKPGKDITVYRLLPEGGTGDSEEEEKLGGLGGESHQ